MRITDEAVAEIAGRMFDGDLVRQPQRVQERVWRDARAALEAALPHLEGATPVLDVTDEDIRVAAEQADEWRTGLSEGATPAIDREAIYDAIEQAAERTGLAKFMEEEDTEAFTSAVLALIGGTS